MPSGWAEPMESFSPMTRPSSLAASLFLSDRKRMYVGLETLPLPVVSQSLSSEKDSTSSGFSLSTDGGCPSISSGSEFDGSSISSSSDSRYSESSDLDYQSSDSESESAISTKKATLPCVRSASSSEEDASPTAFISETPMRQLVVNEESSKPSPVLRHAYDISREAVSSPSLPRFPVLSSTPSTPRARSRNVSLSQPHFRNPSHLGGGNRGSYDEVPPDARGNGSPIIRQRLMRRTQWMGMRHASSTAISPRLGSRTPATRSRRSSVAQSPRTASRARTTSNEGLEDVDIHPDAPGIVSRIRPSHQDEESTQRAVISGPLEEEQGLERTVRRSSPPSLRLDLATVSPNDVELTMRKMPERRASLEEVDITDSIDHRDPHIQVKPLVPSLFGDAAQIPPSTRRRAISDAPYTVKAFLRASRSARVESKDCSSEVGAASISTTPLAGLGLGVGLGLEMPSEPSFLPSPHQRPLRRTDNVHHTLPATDCDNLHPASVPLSTHASMPSRPRLAPPALTLTPIGEIGLASPSPMDDLPSPGFSQLFELVLTDIT